MVVYNREHTVSAAIHSILAQTSDEFELIVVDGMSTDNTFPIVKSLLGEKQHFDFTLLSEPDNGIYDAINKGISIARGQFVMLLHSDDFLLDCMSIDRILGFLDFDEDKVVCFPIDIYDRSRKVYSYGILQPIGLFLGIGHMPPHPGLVINRRLFDEIGLYNDSFRIAADFEFLLRAHQANTAFRVVENFRFYGMNVGGVSSSGLTSFLHISQEIFSIFRYFGFRFAFLRTLARVLPKVYFRYLRRG